MAPFPWFPTQLVVHSQKWTTSSQPSTRFGSISKLPSPFPHTKKQGSCFPAY
ncbi:hypothetical protein GCWU000182_01841 [Abiotrophia defectiva ATCC 49176]|uniref:Uncharacterized protein n=1 Tax=Abiotrophia defectiva ATCC 49176 TaxID=592010 RepID=W1Q1M5_ABIDE|nr:hypothetical protein GCWU000182_01841 [Abiotrophia defectiva ATCC 49176]